MGGCIWLRLGLLYIFLVTPSPFPPPLRQLGANGPSFLEELEGEIIVEAAKFGTVACVVTLPRVAYYFGSCVVAFEGVAAAQACAEAMDGRSFADGFIQVQALGNWGNGEIVPPPPPETGEEAALGEEEGGGGGGEGDDLDDFFSSVEADLEAPMEAPVKAPGE